MALCELMYPCHRQSCLDEPLIVYVLFNGEKLIGFETIIWTATDEIAAFFHISLYMFFFFCKFMTATLL